MIIIPKTTSMLVINSLGSNFFSVNRGSTNEVNSAVVDKNTNAIETFDLMIASKKQYQCNPINTPFPNNFRMFLESIRICCLIKMRYTKRVVQPISILQNTISTLLNWLISKNFPIIPVNPQTKMVK